MENAIKKALPRVGKAEASQDETPQSENVRNDASHHGDAQRVWSKRARSAAIYVTAASLPVLITVLCFALIGVYPFGSITPLSEDFDIAYQYANILTWLQGVLAGEGSLLYSFGKSLGGNMFPTFTYYAASPLNLLLVFFGEGQINDFVFVTRLIRTALCGAAFAFFCRNRFNLNASFVIALATSYALCQFMLTQSTNIMWLDAPWLLPLVALGVHRFVTKKKRSLLVSSMVVAIVSCWYTGYMVVLASFVLFGIEYALSLEAKKANFNWRNLLKSLLGFGLTLFLVALLSMVVLLPSVAGLLAGKASDSSAATAFVRYWPGEFFSSLLNLNYVANWKAPQFFCGTLTLLGLSVLFVSKQVTRRSKVVFVVALLALSACTFFSSLDRAWTGFAEANNYYCRWAFVFEFVMLFGAAFAFSKWKPQMGDALKAAAVVLLLCVVALASGGFNPFASVTETPFTPWLCFVLVVAIIVALACVLLAASKVKAPAIVASVLVALVCVDVGLNAYVSIKGDYLLCKGSYTDTKYEEYIQQESLGLDSLHEYDQGEYRVEKLYSHLQNSSRGGVPTSESLALGYMPLSSYLSTNDAEVSAFMGNMGYMARHTDASSVFQGTYPDAVLPSDSLLGLKYAASSGEVQGYSSTGVSAGLGSHEWRQNKYAFPLGFVVGESALGGIDAKDSSFEYQNELFKKLFSIEEEMYQAADVNIVSQDENQTTWNVSFLGGGLNYIEARPEDGCEECFWKPKTLTVNGNIVEGGYQWVFSYGIVPAGSSDESVVSLSGMNHEKDRETVLYAVTANTALLEKLQHQAESAAFNVKEWNDGYVAGSIKVEEGQDYLFMTIPYDDGWTVKVNGEAVQPEVVADAFMAIPVGVGENEVELSYTPPYFMAGAVVSGLALVLALGLALKARVKKAE